MRQWYVIQVARGREEAMAELVSRVVPAGVLRECFWPQYATELKVRGSWVPVTKPLFPGYLIAVTPDPVQLEAALSRLGEFAHVLRMGDVPVPLASEEVELIDCLTRPGERVVPMSCGVKVGERVVITDGPLKGHEGLISDINRHKSTAYLQIDLCGRKVGARVGLAVLADPQATEAKAASLQVRAAG